MNNRKLDAILACRVAGNHLYGKPVQFIDIDRQITILEYLVRYIKGLVGIDKICLAISDQRENVIFESIAEKNGWDYVYGDPLDVLGRILKAAEKLGTTDVFRVTTESPFIYIENFSSLWNRHVTEKFDFSSFSNLPTGTTFEIISVKALQKSHEDGLDKHRSELVSSYIFDNREKFKLQIMEVDLQLQRSEVRFAVDYPEDLAFCRKVYHDLKGFENLVRIKGAISYWDDNPETRKQVELIGTDWGHGRLWK